MPRGHAREPAPSSSSLSSLSPLSSSRLVALLSGPDAGDSGESGGRQVRRDPAEADPAPEVLHRWESDRDDGRRDVEVYYASAYAARDDGPEPWPRLDRTELCDDDEEMGGTDPFRAPASGRITRSRSGGRAAGPAVLQLPEAIAGARVRPRGLALLGMLLVVLLAAGLFAGRVWWAQREAVPESLASLAAAGEVGEAGDGGAAKGRAGRSASPGASGARSGSAASSRATDSGAVLPVAGASAGPGSAGAASGAPAGQAGDQAAGQVVAHIVGEVRKPGVVTLPAASRVGDAIRRVGGLTPKADGTSVNLARPLVDGEQIVVLARGAAPPPSRAASGPHGTPKGAPAAGAPIDLNSADLAALDELPGVGPVMAQRILAWRTEHGRFSSVDELGEVSGVGEKTLERLRPLVRV